MQKKLLTATAAVFLIFTAACGDINDKSGITEKTIFAMDTAISFKGSREDSQKAAELLSELDELFDRYSEDNEIYAINQRQHAELSEDTKRIIASSAELSEKYGNDVNIFSGDITDCWNISSGNPRVPSDEEIEKALESCKNASFSLEAMSFPDENGSIDLGSVAKGYAFDRVREELGEDSYYIVSSSSSVLLNGKKPDGGKFAVAVRDPETGGTLGTIKTDACFISTSGGYERYFELDGKRYSHIFDLNTGCPSETDLTSVTVICGSGIESDFLSTLIYLGGTARLGEYLYSEEFRVIAVTEDKEIYLSEGVDFELSAESYEIKEFSDE